LSKQAIKILPRRFSRQLAQPRVHAVMDVPSQSLLSLHTQYAGYTATIDYEYERVQGLATQDAYKTIWAKNKRRVHYLFFPI